MKPQRFKQSVKRSRNIFSVCLLPTLLTAAIDSSSTYDAGLKQPTVAERCLQVEQGFRFIDLPLEWQDDGIPSTTVCDCWSGVPYLRWYSDPPDWDDIAGSFNLNELFYLGDKVLCITPPALPYDDYTAPVPPTMSAEELEQVASRKASGFRT